MTAKKPLTILIMALASFAGPGAAEGPADLELMLINKTPAPIVWTAMKNVHGGHFDPAPPGVIHASTFSTSHWVSSARREEFLLFARFGS